MDGLRLTTPKPLLTLDLEDRRDRHARAFDDLMIGIEKLTPEPLGQHPPDSRLASPHQADQIYVSMFFHDRILAECAIETKKAGTRPAFSRIRDQISRSASCRKSHAA